MAHPTYLRHSHDREQNHDRAQRVWRAVCTKNNVDVVKLILGRVVRGRGLVGVTYVGVAYSKWIVVVFTLLMSAGNESPFCLCACHCLQEPVPMSLCH